MYEELMNKIRRAQAEFDFELTNCNNPYRLSLLLAQQAEYLGYCYDKANQIVKELEEEEI